MGLVKHLLELLRGNLFRVQKPVLKSLFVVTAAGKYECIKAIIVSNHAMTSILKALSSPHNVLQKLACSSISNIIAKDQNQAEINKHAVPTLLSILSSDQESKRDALWAIYQMTKCGTAAQIRGLVTQNFDLIIYVTC